MRLANRTLTERKPAPIAVRPLGQTSKRVTAKTAVFVLSAAVGWCFAWLVETAYNSFGPLKAMLLPIVQFLRHLAEYIGQVL